MRTLALSKICTSLAIGFFVPADGTLEAFNQFKVKLMALSRMEHSFFSVFDKKNVLSPALQAAMFDWDSDEDENIKVKTAKPKLKEKEESKKQEPTIVKLGGGGSHGEEDSDDGFELI